MLQPVRNTYFFNVHTRDVRDVVFNYPAGIGQYQAR